MKKIITSLVALAISASVFSQDDNLIGHWSFDGNTNDYSVLKNDGSANGGLI